MVELKTRETDQSVEGFLNSVEDEHKRKDCFALMALMQRVTGWPPRMWGDSIIGFGSYHYKYASGHEGDAALAGFSPRKQNITIYLGSCYLAYVPELEKLGKFTHGKACLYIKTLADVDLAVLEHLIGKCIRKMKELYPQA